MLEFLVIGEMCYPLRDIDRCGWVRRDRTVGSEVRLVEVKNYPEGDSQKLVTLRPIGRSDVRRPSTPRRGEGRR